MNQTNIIPNERAFRTSLIIELGKPVTMGECIIPSITPPGYRITVAVRVGGGPGATGGMALTSRLGGAITGYPLE